MKADTRFSLFSPVKEKKIQPTVPEENAWLSVSCDLIQENGLSVCYAGSAPNNSTNQKSNCFNLSFMESKWTNLVYEHPFMIIN